MGTDDLRTARHAGTDRRRRFSEHLAGYLAVTATLWLSWLLVALAAGTWSPWPLLPTAGWGAGLAFHAWRTSGPPGRPVVRGRPGRRPPTAARPG